MATVTRAIEFCLQYHPLELMSRGRIKNISKIATYTTNGWGTEISARIDEKKNFEPIGSVTNDFENELDTNLRGHIFEFRFSGFTKTSTEIIGLDILSPEISLSIKT